MTTYGKLFILIASCLGNEKIFNVLLPPFQIVDIANCVPRKAKMIYNLEGMEYNIKENISIISIVS